jgi:hypothetical protein
LVVANLLVLGRVTTVLSFVYLDTEQCAVDELAQVDTPVASAAPKVEWLVVDEPLVALGDMQDDNELLGLRVDLRV